MPPTANDSKSCAWVSPYLIHPKNSNILFFGAKDIYKTTSRGNSWTKYSNQLTAADGVGGGMIHSMAVSESDPDSVLYAASYVVLYKTSDGGNSWQNITSNLPTTAGCFDCSAISNITVHPENPKIAWVTMSGYSAVNKVFKTTDGGTSWVNITENLPNSPVNCIIYQKNSKEVLYIGTDLGVFFKDSTDKDWKPFMKNLPNVPVQELEIFYKTGKLRAATFGRGLWESNIYGLINSVDIHNTNGGKWLFPNPGRSYIELPECVIGNNQMITVYSALGVPVNQINATKRIDISLLAPGIYFIKARDKIFKFVKI